jgi:hypothetical protein
MGKTGQGFKDLDGFELRPSLLYIVSLQCVLNNHVVIVNFLYFY